MKKIIAIILLMSCVKIFSQPTCVVSGDNIVQDCPAGYYCPVNQSETGGPVILNCIRNLPK